MPDDPSLLEYYYTACGFKYAVLLPFLGLASLGLSIFALIRCRGPMLAAVLPGFALIPIVVGTLGTFDGLLSSWMIILQSPTTASPAEIAMGKSMSLVTFVAGIVFALPGYLTGMIGSTIIALRRET